MIRQNSGLSIDTVLLPYVALVKMLQLRLINILIRTYNITPSEAYDIWSKALVKQDPRICEILDAIIASEPRGIPIIINRNPTINYGSILQMFCVGYTKTLTMSVPLQVLPSLAADFDGKLRSIREILRNTLPSLKPLNCWKLLRALSTEI